MILTPEQQATVERMAAELESQGYERRFAHAIAKDEFTESYRKEITDKVVAKISRAIR